MSQAKITRAMYLLKLNTQKTEKKDKCAGIKVYIILLGKMYKHKSGVMCVQWWKYHKISCTSGNYV